MKELTGKNIKQMFVNEDQSLLKFTVDDGEEFLIYEAVGDCCSETWFADIIFGWKFFGSKITDVVELEVPEWLNNLFSRDGRGRQEYDQVYGFQLKASDSHCDVIFRNSSNGYYGGWCELMTNLESQWSKEKLERAVWTEIKTDWQA